MEKQNKQILIVDDEINARQGLSELIFSWGYQNKTAADGKEALKVIEKCEAKLVISDLVMENIDGLQLTKEIKEKWPDIEIIILTARGTINSAVETIKAGAFDYITKPVDIVRLKHIIENIFEKIEIKQEVALLKNKLSSYGRFGDLIGNSKQMKEIFHQIELAAPSNASVLISGQSGTGKDVVARTLHKLSPRKTKPFVVINCSAIPQTLLESEIFGHEKGSFTGAEKTKEGCYELADQGTLYLDEIAEMAPDLQAKLLRVIETGKFRRLGGRVEKEANVRIIAATNANISDRINRGLFREDLFYRLNVFCLELPSLKERTEDIPLLAQNFLEEFAKHNKKENLTFDQNVLNLLKSHSWPGNVRELRNVIERATIVCRQKIISIADLPPHMRPRASSRPTVTLQIGLAMDEIEREFLQRTLVYTDGNKTKAAKLLGVSLKTLHNKVNRYGLNQKTV